MINDTPPVLLNAGSPAPARRGRGPEVGAESDLSLFPDLLAVLLQPSPTLPVSIEPNSAPPETTGAAAESTAAPSGGSTEVRSAECPATPDVPGPGAEYQPDQAAWVPDGLFPVQSSAGLLPASDRAQDPVPLRAVELSARIFPVGEAGPPTLASVAQALHPTDSTSLPATDRLQGAVPAIQAAPGAVASPPERAPTVRQAAGGTEPRFTLSSAGQAGVFSARQATADAAQAAEATAALPMATDSPAPAGISSSRPASLAGQGIPAGTASDLTPSPTAPQPHPEPPAPAVNQPQQADRATDQPTWSLPEPATGGAGRPSLPSADLPGSDPVGFLAQELVTILTQNDASAYRVRAIAPDAPFPGPLISGGDPQGRLIPTFQQDLDGSPAIDRPPVESGEENLVEPVKSPTFGDFIGLPPVGGGPAPLAAEPASQASAGLVGRPLLEELAEQAANLVRGDRRSIALRLEPDALGGMQLFVEERGQQLQVRLVVETALAYEALHQRVPELERLLADRGFNLTAWALDLGSGGIGSGAGEDRSGQAFGRERGGSAEGEPDESSTPQGSRRPARSFWQIDRYV